ncbi:MAG TPA: hypothetical protein VGM90_40940 [Kofleriaceae bacterium]|jgi:hypothetical protein
MKWLDRVRARADAMPKSELDHWLHRQRAVALRLPRWLVGTSIVSTLAFGVWCVVYHHGLWRPMMWLSDGDTFYAALTTAVLPVFPTVIVLYVLARVLTPHEPSNLPTARVKR